MQTDVLQLVPLNVNGVMGMKKCEERKSNV